MIRQMESVFSIQDVSFSIPERYKQKKRNLTPSNMIKTLFILFYSNIDRYNLQSALKKRKIPFMKKRRNSYVILLVKLLNRQIEDKKVFSYYKDLFKINLMFDKYIFFITIKLNK